MTKEEAERLLRKCEKFRDEVMEIRCGYNSIEMDYPAPYTCSGFINKTDSSNKINFIIKPAKNGKIYISDNGDIVKHYNLTLQNVTRICGLRNCAVIRKAVQGFDDLTKQLICDIYTIVKPYYFLQTMRYFQDIINTASIYKEYNANAWSDDVAKQREREFKRWKDGKIKVTERIWGLDY